MSIPEVRDELLKVADTLEALHHYTTAGRIRVLVEEMKVEMRRRRI